MSEKQKTCKSNKNTYSGNNSHSPALRQIRANSALLIFLGGGGNLYINTRERPWPVFVGPCHHVMARPQVADGGTASDMEGNCE